MHYFLSIIVFLWLPFTEKVEDDWKLVNEEDGIEVFTRLTDDSPIKEVKVYFEIAANLPEFMAILNNVDQYTAWVYKCKSAEKIEAVSNSEFYYYTESDFPFPISNRDMVLHSTQTVSEDGKTIKSRSVAAADKLPEEDGIVRITEFESTWEIQQLSEGKLKIEYQASTDPGGYLPAWVINLGVASAPLHTMQQLKSFIAEAK